jgi:hypothetical protein
VQAYSFSLIQTSFFLRLFCAAYSKEACRNGLKSHTNQPFPAMDIMICSSVFQTMVQLHQEDVGIHSNSQCDISQCGSEYSVVISTVADRKCIIWMSVHGNEQLTF